MEFQAIMAAVRRLDEAMGRLSGEQKQVSAAIGAVQEDLQSILRLVRVQRKGGQAQGKAQGQQQQQHHPHEDQQQPLAAAPASDPPPSSSPEQQKEVQQPDAQETYEEASANGDREIQVHAMAGISPENPEGGIIRSISTDTPRAGGFVAPSLPMGWPQVLKVRRGLEEDSRICSTMSSELRFRARSTTFWSRSSSKESEEDSESDGEPNHWRSLRCVVQDPGSLRRAAFDVCSWLVLLWDLTVAPYVLAWDLTLDTFLLAAGWATCFFWTAEMGMSFLTGFYQSGKVELKPIKVARHYLRTWFLPDLVVLLCDYVSMLLASIAFGNLKLARFVIFGRVLRILCFVRIMKLSRHVERHMEHSVSDNSKMVLKVVCGLLGVIYLSHWVACTWILIGRVGPSDTGMRWIDASTAVDDDFLVSPGMYPYITAVHWSVAQFTLVGMEINCFNSTERLFCILCQMVGLLAGSTLVSLLSAKMVELQMTVTDHKDKFRRLRQYLRENKVERKMVFQILQQVMSRQRRMQRLTEDEVPAIRLLSESLRVELRFEIFSPHLETHPLFQLWMSMDKSMVLRLCTDNIALMFYRPKDDLFTAGSRAEQIFFLARGRMNYIQDPDFSACEEVTETPVNRGQWLCEAALWTDWIHVGKAEAETDCEMLSITAVGVIHALEMHLVVRDITLDYCRQFHRRLISAKPPDAPWPDDLQVPFTEYSDIVVSMTADIQVRIGLHALEHATSQVEAWSWDRGRSVRKKVEKLRGEILQGKSTVMMNAQGQPERVVSVVALHVERKDGYVLVQLGRVRLEGSEAEPCCQLPGVKQEQGETCAEALRRILATKLAPLAGTLEQLRIEREVEWKLSREYGIQTKYLRTVCWSRPKDELAVRGVVWEDAPGLPGSPRKSRREVLVLRDRGFKVFYCWLAPCEFSRLSRGSQDAELVEWLAALQQQTAAVSI